MNNESPLIPQGSLLEQKNKGRDRVKIAVFIVLAIHGIGLMALLMQGCQKAPDSTANTQTNSTDVATTPSTTVPDTTIAVPPAFDHAAIMAPDTNQQPVTTGSTQVTQIAQPPATGNQPPTTTETAPPSGVTKHKVVRGDTLLKLSKNYKVPVKAIEAANPGVDPLKLKIDQVLHIPAPVPGGNGSETAATAARTGESNGSGKSYKVKSGDTLTRVASNHGVSVKALRAANNLRTDRIKVGDVLKIPAKAGGTPTAALGTETPLTASNAPAR